MLLCKDCSNYGGESEMGAAYDRCNKLPMNSVLPLIRGELPKASFCESNRGSEEKCGRTAKWYEEKA